MTRISGVDLPAHKRVPIALTYIYGIGHVRARKIVQETGIDQNERLKSLDEQQVLKLREYIENNFKVEGELRTEVFLNIKRLMEINCYSGIRHKKGMPVRGQRTHTNSRTRKGKKPEIGSKKKKR